MVDSGHDVVELGRRYLEHGAELRGGVLTEWHSPTVRIGLVSATAQHSIAIGFTYCSSSASGHSSSISRQMSSSTGIVRRPRMIPPIPSVSAIV